MMDEAEEAAKFNENNRFLDLLSRDTVFPKIFPCADPGATD
jgi:hypothetical protein